MAQTKQLLNLKVHAPLSTKVRKLSLDIGSPPYFSANLTDKVAQLNY